ncbi:Cellulose synthase-like protein D2 [Hibiscus syriacus]|uniref:Cellulose synthase-like protein D2 n=1 Tax=Hibiscus syriacus TaxID=106335 RepID=A0A6A2Y9S3_HIBSY|nr:Cellulose synthase-like protein D2 [Hibiscus syriacus]
MACVFSQLAAKFAFIPPSPPTYQVKDDNSGKLKLLSSSSVPVADDPSLDVLLIDTKLGNKIVGFYFKNPYARLTLLYSHGNAVDLGQLYDLFVQLKVNLRVNLMGYDYSGYGASAGKPSESNTYADIEAVYQCLQTEYGISQEDLILYGQSVGSGPTLHLAAKLPRLRGVVLHSGILSGLRVLCHVKSSLIIGIRTDGLLVDTVGNEHQEDSEGEVPCPCNTCKSLSNFCFALASISKLKVGRNRIEHFNQGTEDDVVDWLHGNGLWKMAREPAHFSWILAKLFKLRSEVSELFCSIRNWTQINARWIWDNIRCRRRRLPTKDRLTRFGIAVDSGCGLCRSGFESRDHIFSDCAFAVGVWHAILHACGLSQEPLCWNDLICWLMLNLKGKSLLVQILKLTWSEFIYFIWKERNHKLFRGKDQTMASGPRITRRTPTIHHITNSAGDIDNENDMVDSSRYTVHLLPTSDNQPMPMEIAMQSVGTDDQYVSDSMFTGGYNRVTRAHSKKIINSDPATVVAEGSFFEIPGCGSKMMTNLQGVDVFPRECGFRICKDCYIDAIATGDGFCPGCKEHYRVSDVSEMAPASNVRLSKSSRRMPVVESTEPLMRSHSNDDHKLFPEKQWKPLTQKSSIRSAILSPYRLLILIRIVVLGLFLQWRISHPNEDAIWLWFMSVICEIWFAFSWLLDQLPKLCPLDRAVDLDALQEKFKKPSSNNPSGISDIPGIDVFVSTADPEKEPPLVTANTILSILAAEYPVEKLACYVSDDGGALLTFKAMAEAGSFARIWVPLCRKHEIQPRNPEFYFNLKRDPCKNKVRLDFVRDHRQVKREYYEFKVSINGLSDSIRQCSDAFNKREEVKILKRWREDNSDEPMETLKIPKATWMADRTHWPGTWTVPAPEHSRGDHASIIQMMDPPRGEPQNGTEGDGNSMDPSEVDIRLPMLVYVTREKRPGYDHNKKAGAMNALVRASAIMSNGPFILNLDCDHYVYNSLALREGICFMMDRDGERICYVQFPQRFEGFDPFDRYANHNTVFFDVNMRTLDGLQGPVYVGTGCLFRRTALYGFEPHPSI